MIGFNEAARAYADDVARRDDVTRDALYVITGCKPDGWLSYKPEQAAEAEAKTGLRIPTNDERALAETIMFHLDPPDRLFAYVKRHRCGDPCNCLLLNCEITGFMGNRLSQWRRGGLGRSYKSNMGDTRYPIHFTGTNGIKYAGTFYASSGDYCRVKRVKS